MAPALPCNFGSAPNVLTTCLGFLFFFCSRGWTLLADMFENRVLLTLPSHFEVPPMLSNGQLVCRPQGRQSERSALNTLQVTTRVHMQQKKKSPGPHNQTCAKSPARNDPSRKQSDGPLLGGHAQARLKVCLLS